MAVLVLAIETSSSRGSVALVESGRVLADAWHEEPHAHGERLLGLLDGVFRQAGRNQGQLDRVAVGRGPGAFTGLRVGLALAQGIASGLGIPAVGVGSLRAMAAAVSSDTVGHRWPILDARRGELFVACFGADGAELLAPIAVPRQRIAETLMRLASDIAPASTGNWLLGHALAGLPELSEPSPGSTSGFSPYRSDSADWPGAVAVGLIASNPTENAPTAPEYLRDADAVLPNLPRSPLLQPLRVGP
jgi:tRNA threonylcarbamoyladenosine biosynthesis protein TsaB